DRRCELSATRVEPKNAPPRSSLWETPRAANRGLSSRLISSRRGPHGGRAPRLTRRAGSKGDDPRPSGVGNLLDRASRSGSRRSDSDPADLVAVLLGEPEVALRTDRDSGGSACAGGYRKSSHHSGGRDPPNSVDISLGKPDIPVGARDDTPRTGIGRRNRKLRDRSRRRDPSDLVCERFGKPE